MSKINLTDATTLTNETSFVSTLNTNFATIETASDNFLSLDGTSPNSMAADLDMNSNRILNLSDAVSAQEPLTLSQASTLISGGTITTGAPTNASYVTLGTNATLSAERVLTAGTHVSFTDGGAGSTLTVNTSGFATSTTDNAVVRFDSTAGNTQNSIVIVDDTGNITGTQSNWISKTVTATPSDAGGSTLSVNLNRIAADNVDASTGFIIGTQNRYVFGGSTVKGGRIANYNFVANTVATNSANTNRNYVGSVDVAYTAVGDGGSDTSTNAKGAYFGANPSVHLDTGATNVLNATPFECDVMLSTGSSARYASCGSFVGFNAVRGTEVDAGITFGGGTAHIGWKHGILFSDYNRATTENPFYSGSTIVGTYWQSGGSGVPTVTSGIDFGDGSTTGFVFTGSAFKSKGFSIDGSGNATVNTLLRGAPVTKTNDFTLGVSENWLICNKAGTTTVTLPTASLFTGREIHLKTLQAQTVISISSNVCPNTTNTPGTAILPATAGAWCTMVSDGTNWIRMASSTIA